MHRQHVAQRIVPSVALMLALGFGEPLAAASNSVAFDLVCRSYDPSVAIDSRIAAFRELQSDFQRQKAELLDQNILGGFGPRASTEAARRIAELATGTRFIANTTLRAMKAMNWAAGKTVEGASVTAQRIYDDIKLGKDIMAIKENAAAFLAWWAAKKLNPLAELAQDLTNSVSEFRAISRTNEEWQSFSTETSRTLEDIDRRIQAVDAQISTEIARLQGEIGKGVQRFCIEKESAKDDEYPDGSPYKQGSPYAGIAPRGGALPWRDQVERSQREQQAMQERMRMDEANRAMQMRQSRLMAENARRSAETIRAPSQATAGPQQMSQAQPVMPPTANRASSSPTGSRPPAGCVSGPTRRDDSWQKWFAENRCSGVTFSMRYTYVNKYGGRVRPPEKRTLTVHPCSKAQIQVFQVDDVSFDGDWDFQVSGKGTGICLSMRQ